MIDIILNIKAMKRILFTLLSGLLLPVCTLTAQLQPDAVVSYATFRSEGTGYVEIYLHVLGKSVTHQPVADSSGQSAVNVVILFQKGDQVVKFDKYRLNGPVGARPVDFVDLKRYALENGEYKVDVSVEDANLPGSAKQFGSTFRLDYSGEALQQSDIQLLASIKPVGEEDKANAQMVKSGYVFEPLPSHFYDKNDGALLFYHEIYNADKAIADDFVVSYFIDDESTPDKVEALSMSHKRKSPEPVNVLLQQIDIQKLPSGNYQLVVEIRNRERVLLGRKSVPFQRSNPFLHQEPSAIASVSAANLDDEFVAALSSDELAYSLKAIVMQLDKNDGEQIKLLVKERNVNAMRLYLFSYWASKDPNNPKAAYDAYMNVARKIDEKFRNGFGHGFETDRGYIFLKYGAPNDIVSEENEPSAPPYEIWFYNQFPATGQNNVKFLFYNPNLTTNGFVLLHSTARGEINNPRWELTLYRNSPTEIENNDYMDGNRMQGNTGRHARRLFESY